MRFGFRQRVKQGEQRHTEAISKVRNDGYLSSASPLAAAANADIMLRALDSAQAFFTKILALTGPRQCQVSRRWAVPPPPPVNSHSIDFPYTWQSGTGSWHRAPSACVRWQPR